MNKAKLIYGRVEQIHRPLFKGCFGECPSGFGSKGSCHGPRTWVQIPASPMEKMGHLMADKYKLKKNNNGASHTKRKQFKKVILLY